MAIDIKNATIGSVYTVKGKGLAVLKSVSKGWCTLEDTKSKTTIKVRASFLTATGDEKKGPRFRDPATGRVIYFGRMVRHKNLLTEGGNVPFDNNDEVAAQLRGKPVEDQYSVVASVVAKAEGVTKGEALAALKKKYGKLNLGQQRMCLGNKLRGLLNDDSEGDDE